jgi:hypothetical protein
VDLINGINGNVAAASIAVLLLSRTVVSSGSVGVQELLWCRAGYGVQCSGWCVEMLAQQCQCSVL